MQLSSCNYLLLFLNLISLILNLDILKVDLGFNLLFLVSLMISQNYCLLLLRILLYKPGMFLRAIADIINPRKNFNWGDSWGQLFIPKLDKFCYHLPMCVIIVLLYQTLLPKKTNEWKWSQLFVKFNFDIISRSFFGTSKFCNLRKATLIMHPPLPLKLKGDNNKTTLKSATSN